MKVEKRKYIVVKSMQYKDFLSEVNGYLKNDSGILCGGIFIANHNDYTMYYQAMTILVESLDENE